MRGAAVIRFGFALRSAVVVSAILVCGRARTAQVDATAPAKWVTLTNCRFLPDDYNDGDSFHVKFGEREFIFRLYFVDAPEVETNLVDRTREQSEYFGVTPEEIRKFGQRARAFTAESLKKPFVVTTRWQNAMGRSKLPRYYALVKVGDQDLAELLVSRGLARAKGTVANLPNGEHAKPHMERLKKLESEAREKRVGIWAHSTHTKPGSADKK